MTRLIDADALKLSHCKECTLYPDKCMGKDCDLGAIIHINEMPTIDAEPVKHGKWKPFDLTYGWSVFYCTNCEDVTEVPRRNGVPQYRYCPRCGARMDEDV